MIDKAKTILKEKLNMDGYRLVLILGVFTCVILLMYVALLKESSRETIFIEYNQTDSTLIILDYQGKVIVENLKTLKANEDEIREAAAVRPVDSIGPSIIRAVRGK
jgi:hypothetical protein